jgi:hypothetical protein
MSKKAAWIFSVMGPRCRAELDAVELADRRHLGGGAGEEGLVADVDLVARDALFHQLQAQVLADVRMVLRVMPFSAPADRSGV